MKDFYLGHEMIIFEDWTLLTKVVGTNIKYIGLLITFEDKKNFVVGKYFLRGEKLIECVCGSNGMCTILLLHVKRYMHLPVLIFQLYGLTVQASFLGESKKYKAAIIRIDSPGGDALASDLMWREIRLLAAEKPVIASMADVAASGGYYMAMGTEAIVAESLTLTGSIGVVTGKFNLGKLYEKIGFNKEIISRGKFAELTAAEQRSFRPEEADLFAKSAQYAYAQFRDKAAHSRSMPVDKMEENAQGRVWTGGDAASRGLVDAIGGMSRAVAIAKQKANIPLEQPVTLVELSRPSPSLPELLSGIGSTVGTLASVDGTLKALLQELTSLEGVQARMDGIIFEKMDDASYSNPIISILKDYLSSL